MTTNTRKKKAAKKTAGKAPPSMPQKKAVEVKVSDLDTEQLAKRCSKIYALERDIEGKTKLDALARRNAKNTKAALTAAQAALTKEITEQRFGPGPLFDPSGTGPAN